MKTIECKVYKSSEDLSKVCFIPIAVFNNKDDEHIIIRILSSAYNRSLTSPKRKAKSSSLLWFMLSLPSFDFELEINERGGFIDASLTCDVAWFNITDTAKLTEDLHKHLKNAFPLLGAYLLKVPLKELKILYDIDVEVKECLDKDCKYFKQEAFIRYIVATKSCYNLIAPVVGALFGDYLGLYGYEIDNIDDFYITYNNRKTLNISKLDKVEKIKKVKDKLVKLKYIDEHYIPLVEFKKIREKISELFNSKKTCVICGKEFTPNRDGQIVCPAIKCQKRQSRIKKLIMNKFTKDTPKREIIDYLKRAEDLTIRRLGSRFEIDRVKDWDALVDKLLVDLGWKRQEK